MPSVTSFQTNFTAGALSPRLYGRVDISKYANGCHTLENFIVQRFGGIRKRGGLQFIREVKDSSKPVRLIEFTPLVTQSYILEFGGEYIRFYTNGGIVEVTGTPVEVATPWDEVDIWQLQFVQSVDVLYIVHPEFAPRALSRTGATSFSLDVIEFSDGPYLELETEGTTLTPAARGAVTPIMSSNTTPSGTASNSAAGADAWQVFDGNGATFDFFTLNTGTWTYLFPGGTTKVADAYWIQARDVNNIAGRSPAQWKFQGYDGTNWITLDSRTGENGWAGGERRYFEFINEVAYQGYRLVVAATDSLDDNLTVAELAIHEKATTQTPFNLTASTTAGLNGGAGFLSTDVGRPIRLLGSDGRWRWARIIAYTSTTVVTIQIYGHALPDTEPIATWQLGAWSDETGWPGSIGFYSGRLCLARTAQQPQTVWFSQVDDFTNFGVSEPLVDSDAITATIASGSLEEIKWIAEASDLIVGTSVAIRTIGPTSAASAFSPTNIRQARQTNYGASSVQPARVGLTALYSGYYRKDIREIVYSFDVNGYISQDISLLAEHIPAAGVKQIAYAQNPDSVVWLVMDDGSLAGMTYERDQEVVAFHTQPIAGTGVFVESVASIPGSVSDEVWFVVRRTINGGTKRHIERLTIGLSDTAAKEAATFLDSHLAYSGSSTTTLTGLGHLEGEAVHVWSGVKQGPYTVTAGSITIGTAVTTATVGLAYTSAMETLSPEAAARGGTAQTRQGRISEVFPRLDRSMNGSIGPADGTLEALDYTKSTDTDGSYGVATAMFTGDVRVAVGMEWERQKRLRLEHSDPTPFHCLGLIAEIRVSG